MVEKTVVWSDETKNVPTFSQQVVLKDCELVVEKADSQVAWMGNASVDKTAEYWVVQKDGRLDIKKVDNQADQMVLQLV